MTETAFIDPWAPVTEPELQAEAEAVFIDPWAPVTAISTGAFNRPFGTVRR